MAKKQSLLHGAAILTGAMIVVKILGAAFKIPLQSILTETGTAYFNTAYTLFTPIYALALTGLPTAVAKMVAESEACGRYRDMRKIRRMSFTLFLLIGIVGSIIMAASVKLYIRVSDIPGAYLSVLMIAPALFFACVTSAIRGYFEGTRNMYPTAVSEVVEVLVKLVVGLAATWSVIYIGKKQFDTAGVVFGKTVTTDAEAMAVILPLAAAAAVFGVTLSTFGGMLFLIIRYKRTGDGLTREQLVHAPKPRSGRQLLGTLIKIAIPISLSAFVLNLATLIDTMTVTNIMNDALANNPAEMNALFGGVIPPEKLNTESFGVFMYGSYSLAFSIFNLIPAFTGMFGKSALPNVASCWAVRDRAGTQANVEATLRVTSLFSIPAGLGLFALSQPILELLYGGSNPAGVQIAAPAMQIMGISIIFLAILTPTFSMLQGIGKVYFPVVLMLIGSVMKIIVNIILIRIPAVNLSGASWGTLVCYLFIAVISVWMLVQITHIKLNFVSVFLKPLIAGGFCAVAAWASYGLLSRLTSSKIITLVAIAIAAVVYAVVLLLVKGIAKDDLLMLPKGEKIAKTLEKHGLIG